MYKIPALILFPLFIFFSCGPSSLAEDTRTVFNYNEMSGISSLDPAAASNFENIWPVNQLFNGLLQMDDSLNVKPSIAKSFSISADGLKYSFFLRQDVYFHNDPCFKNGDGRKATAQDFVYSFGRLFDSKVSSAVTLLGNINTNVKEGFEALNDTVLNVYLKTPFSAFLSILTMKYFSVVPYEAVKMYGQDFRKHPVGTGPFRFKTWDEGTKLILLKNENYFETDAQHIKMPYLDAITVSFIRDREAAFMELLNGKFDMLSGADAFNSNEVLDREGNLKETYLKKYYLQKQEFLKTDYIGILVDDNLLHVKTSPLKLKSIRQAINYGFDRVRLVKYLRNNIGAPATSGFIPKGMKSFDADNVKGYSYNPEKTAELLKLAGFPKGKGLPELTLHITDSYKEQVEFIQSQLASNNIRVQVSVEKTSVLRQAVNRGEYLMFKKSWVADYPDEENFMSLFYSANFAPDGVNYFHFKNAMFDKLYEAVQSETDEKIRTSLFQKMDSLVIEECPVIPLYYDQVVRLVSNKIKGLGNNSMNLLNLKTVTKTN
jgi:oligopeptide transport system substrate-binding protein